MREAKFTKLTTIALTPEMFSRVKAIADARKISNAEWFREVIERALTDDNKKVKEQQQ